MTSISKLQAEIASEYISSLGLSSDARYISGAPLRPVVPLDTAIGGVFFLGAYPSARFEVVGGQTDVPVADNMGPFENERWFDGVRVRVQPSARELHDYFLGPLHLDRSKCWVTDLVKVFLFKEGHRRRYEALGVKTPTGFERERFSTLGRMSLPWIAREIAEARPTLIVTLGAEVAGVVNHTTSKGRQTALLCPDVRELPWGEHRVPTIHCAHPGILMRPSPRNPWQARHLAEFIPAIREVLERVRNEAEAG